MNWKVLLLLGVALAGAMLAGMWFFEAEKETVDLTLLHTNDIHAHYDSFEPWGEIMQGGVTHLKTVVDDVRAEEKNVLLLDAGDQFQGTLFYTVGGADVVGDVMNAFGYDAMCVGNHEFDSGPAELAKLIELADFPVLSANVDATADADLSPGILPFALYRFDDTPVAVFGLTTEYTAVSSSPGPDVVFLDAITTARETVANLEAAGVEIIVALTHLGYARDLELARSVSGIDIVVGGHSHTLLGSVEGAVADYPTVIVGPTGEPVLVVTAQEWGKWLGRLDVSFTEAGRIASYDGDPVFIDATIPPDAGIAAVLDKYRPAIDALMTQAVGTTDVILDGDRDRVRSQETNLGNLICDAMVWKTAAQGVTIAIQNGGGIRSTVPAGEISMGQVLEVLPYGNLIAILSLSGAQLVATLENGVSQIESGAGRFAQVAGVRYTYDPDAAAGSRIRSVETWDDESDSYVPVDLAAAYRVATNNYLADGGDDYGAFTEASERYDTGWLVSDTFAEYLTAVGTVTPNIEGRITPSE